MFQENGLALYADPRNAAELGRHDTLAGYLKTHFGRARHAGDYVALLAYVERNEAHEKALTAMRAKIRDKTRAATCLGFGPRFQHSTGQAYKGGPNSGVFLQITCDDPADLDVPGHSYSFGIVKAAQARGDFDVLAQRGRRALRVHLKDVDSGIGRTGAWHRSRAGVTCFRQEGNHADWHDRTGPNGRRHGPSPDEGGA